MDMKKLEENISVMERKHEGLNCPACKNVLGIKGCSLHRASYSARKKAEFEKARHQIKVAMMEEMFSIAKESSLEGYFSYYFNADFDAFLGKGASEAKEKSEKAEKAFSDWKKNN